MSQELPFHTVSLPPREKPKTGKAPLILMLHGYGSHENDLFSFAEDFNQHHHILSLRAPLRLGFGGFAWYEINFNAEGDKWTDVDAGLRSLSMLEEFVENVDQHYDVDSSNITLIGFSQGAIMSYAYAFRNPDRVRRVAALSGYIVQELMPSKAVIKSIQKIDFMIMHGSMDMTIPVSWAEQSVAHLERLQIPHTFRKYSMPHGINPEAYADLKSWFLRN